MFRYFVVALFVGLTAFAVESSAVVRTWDGGGADGNWTTAGNWVGDVAPAANDDLVFPLAATQFATNNNFPLFTTFRSIMVEDGAYTIGGNLFRLTSGITATAGTLTINTAVTFSGAQTVSSGTAGTITLVAISLGGAQLTIDGAGITVIGLVSGSGPIVKNGDGVGAIITASGYSSPITVNNGIFVVDANIPGSSVTVNSTLPTGGTDLSGLAGTGTVGAVNIIGGGISSGSINSPTGILNISGGLTLSANSGYAAKLAGTTAGTGHDQLNVTGAVNLGNALLAPVPWNSFVPVVGNSFTIIRNDGTDAVNGTFQGLPEGAVFAGPLNTSFRISYVAGDGNDVAITVVPSADLDFDGDGKTDIGVNDGTTWHILQSSSGTTASTQFGLTTDILAPADFDGDNRTDIAVFRPENGQWFILNSGTSTVRVQQFGLNGDLPVPNDFDGDGIDDIAVFRPSNGVWYQLRSLSGTAYSEQFGANGDKPQIADVDGDGLGDLAVFRPADGTWHFMQSSTQSYTAFPFGLGTDTPLMADFNGDGRTDVVIFRPTDDPSTPDFYILNFGTFDYRGAWLGSTGDKAVVGDYDGDGSADVGVFRPSNGVWYIDRTTAGFTAVAFGNAGDRLVPAAYVR